jgi:rare lipoprotein A
MRASLAIALIVSSLTAPSCASSYVRRHGTMTVRHAPPADADDRGHAAAPDAVDPGTTVGPVEAASTASTAPSSVPASEWDTAPALETLSGRVSYYHDSLAGNHTANGEVYDPQALTCASRDLPFGTLIRVVRPDTGAFVIVRVNDRGPWGRRRPRILDLSRAAAEALDMIRAGVIEVRAEVVRRGE